MNSLKFPDKEMPIKKVELISGYSTLSDNPRFEFSMIITDQIDDEDGAVYLEIRDVELVGIKNAKELFGKEIKLSELELNKSINVEYLDGNEVKIVSLSFQLTNPSNPIVSIRGTVLYKESNKMKEFSLRNPAFVKPTHIISKLHHKYNEGKTRVDLIRIIGHIYNFKGMVAFKNQFPNVHFDYKLLDDWNKIFGVASILFRSDYSTEEFVHLSSLDNLIKEIANSFPQDQFPDYPEICNESKWNEARLKARIILETIELKGGNPMFLKILEN